MASMAASQGADSIADSMVAKEVVLEALGMAVLTAATLGTGSSNQGPRRKRLDA
jgi:hypothetical protein